MKLNKYIDHTLLKQDATEKQIDCLLSEAKSMILPVFVLIRPGLNMQKGLEDTDVKVCTVVGFPLEQQLQL